MGCGGSKTQPVEGAHGTDNPDNGNEEGKNDMDQVTSINIKEESKTVNDADDEIENNNSNIPQQSENHSQQEQKETVVQSFTKSSVSLQSLKNIVNREETSDQASKDADSIHEILNDSHNVQVVELLKILGPISYGYRQSVREVYKERYNENLLVKIFINEDRDNEVALRNLLRNTLQFLAQSMNQSIKNNDYQTMVDILTAWPSENVTDAKKFYEQEFRVSCLEDVSHALNDKMSDDLKSMIMALASLQRADESQEVNEDTIDDECTELSQGAKGIVDVLTAKPYNKSQLAAIFKQFKEKFFLDIKDSIEIEYQDEIEVILKSIVGIVEDTPLHFAKQIQEIFSKKPLNKDRLTFIIIGRHPIDLKEIDEKYKELTNCSLAKEIESHLKGHVKDLLNLVLERSKRG